MFGGAYGTYVAIAYGATVVILAGLVWATVAQSRRARRELDEVERPARREAGDE